MKWIRENITLSVTGAVVALLFSVLGVLYAEQNKKIDGKADQGEVVQMVQKLEALRQMQTKQYSEEKDEQKVLNTEMMKTLQQLNIQIILLNEKLKKEGDGS